MHSVENIGATDLVFTTVEFLDSPKARLPVPDSVRLKTAGGVSDSSARPRLAWLAPAADFVEMSQEIGRVFVDPVGPRPFELILPVAA